MGSTTVLTVTLEMRGSSLPGCSLIGTSGSTKSAWLVESFLDSIENAVVLNVQEVNKALYMYIPELEKALVRTF